MRPLAVARQSKGAFAEIDLVDVVKHNLRIEALGMLQKALHELRALHAMHVGRPVVHLGGGHQLAALGNARDEQGLQVGAGRINGCRIAGRA